MVPDDLDLKESIVWVNNVAPELNSGLAFSIHLNACGQCGASGAETYFYGGSKSSEEIAKKVIDKYCKITGFKNRGARPDTMARWGRLGWIRNTKPWACLIECCYMDNEVDLKKLKSDYQRVAFGIYEGICDVYEVVPGSIPGTDEPKEELTDPAVLEAIKLSKKLEREKVKKQIIDFVNKL